MRFKVTIPSANSIETTRDLLGRFEVVVFGVRHEPPTLYVGELSEAIVGALKAVGCSIEEDALDEFECVEFSDKIDHALAMAIKNMASPYRNQRLISVVCRTTLSPSRAAEELEPYDYNPYPGLGSTFIMTVSVSEIEQLINEDFIVSISMPRSIKMPGGLTDA